LSEIITSLRQSDIFYQFTQTQLELVANLCIEKSYGAGDVLFEENTRSKELYIVVQGEVAILVNPGIVGTQGSAEKVIVTTMRRGQSFGEIAVVDEGLRSATAQVKNKGAVLLVIPRGKLIMLCDTYPQLGYRLMYNLAADLAMKIRNTDLRVREQILYGQKKQ
jgi:CRP/FNR family cyclic AMP-dependent transcriptional regulator